MSNGGKTQGALDRPRTKILLLLLCVLSATMAPSLLYEMLVVALVACLEPPVGKYATPLLGLLSMEFSTC